MTFAGLPLATLLPIAGAALALTVVFYILKLRRRPVAVPFSPLWHSVLGDRDASKLFSQLKRWLSLLLQLALVTALLIALGDPRPTATLGEGRNLVLLIDASASMKAVDVTPTRLAAAKDEARKIVRGLGGSDRALVVQMGPVPVPLSTLSGDSTELVPAIDRVRASDTRADLARALELARDALRGLSRAEIVVVSDGALVPPEPAPALAPIALRFVPVGASSKNLAVTEFSVRRYPLDKSRLEVMAEVLNTTNERAEVELSLWGDGAIVDSERLTVAAGERVARFFPDVGGARHALEARLRYADGRADDLPADDRAYALIPERRRARVLVVTAGNTYLEAALLLDEYLDVTEVAPGAYPAPGIFDVTLFDGVAPPLADNARSVIYLNPPANGPVKLGKAISGFGFDTWDKKSPIVRFLALGDVQVASGHAFEPESGDKVVGASDEGPILVAGTRAGRRFIALGFDPRNSDLVLRPAWPLLVLNAIDSFGEVSSSYLSSYRTGEVWRVPVPAGSREAELTGPGGSKRRVPVQDGHAVSFGDEAGFYRLASLGGDAEHPVSEFAANLSDLDESRIAPQKTLSVGGKAAPKPEVGAPSLRREIWIYLLAAVALVSLIEWVTYHRRVTV